MDSFKIGPTKAYSLFRSSPTNSSVEKPLFDDEFPKVLLAMQEEAYNLIVAKEFQTAIPKLKKLEQVLEVVVIQGGPSDSDLILATIHNIALCYQRLGDLEKCNAYLEGCIFNVSKVGVMRVNSSMTETELRKDVYKIKLFVQSCAVFSQLERHKKAFENAKNALKLSIATIKLTIKACKSEIDKYKSLKKKNAHISNDLRKSFKLIYMSYPAIKALRKYIVTGSLDHVPKMRSVLGIKDDPDWINSLTISDIMFLQPYTTDDLKQSLGLQIEFTNDYLLFKIILLAVSHFCMSTELRFMAAYDDAQKSHHKSLDLLRHFVPDISPLRIHIEESYKKRFGDNEIITKTADSFNQRQRHPSQLPSIIERPESLSPRLIDIKSKNFSKTLRPKSVMGKTKIIVPWITDFNKKKNLTLKPSVLRRKDSHEETKVSTSARLDWG